MVVSLVIWMKLLYVNLLVILVATTKLIEEVKHISSEHGEISIETEAELIDILLVLVAVFFEFRVVIESLSELEVVDKSVDGVVKALDIPKDLLDVSFRVVEADTFESLDSVDRIRYRVKESDGFKVELELITKCSDEHGDNNDDSETEFGLVLDTSDVIKYLEGSFDDLVLKKEDIEDEIELEKLLYGAADDSLEVNDAILPWELSTVELTASVDSEELAVGREYAIEYDRS